MIDFKHLFNYKTMYATLPYSIPSLVRILTQVILSGGPQKESRRYGIFFFFQERIPEK